MNKLVKIIFATCILISTLLASSLKANNVIVKIDSVSASNGAQVVVAVRVKNFQNIVSAQGTISFNPAVATYSAITQFGVTGMNISNFGLNQISSGKLLFSWSDANLNGVSLADSSVLFSIKFDVVGNAGQQTAVSLINSPTTIEFVNSSFNTVSVTSIDGKIVIPSGSSQTNLTLFADSLGGLSGSQVIMPIKVKQFNQIVSAQGTVTFNQNIASFVGIEQIGLPGMTLSDFGTSQVNNGKLMFSWSDATLNGQNLPDSTAIFKIKFTLVGNAGQQTAVNFASSPVSLEFINTSLNTVAVISQPGVIKITSTPVPTNLTLKIDSVNGVNGGQVILPVRVKDFINILSMQGSINFDPSVASFVSVQQFGFNSLDVSNFGTSLTNSGKLTFSWYDANLTGQTLADSSILFSLKFNLIGNPGSQTNVSFSSNPVTIEFIHSNYNSIAANLINGNIKLFGNISISTSALSLNTFCAGQNISVPFTASSALANGNVFTAQLSDAGGNFGNPTDIGSLTAFNSGIINAIIPSNTIGGNAYRIRVVSSNPNIIGNDNGSNLIIGNLPEKPVTPTGSSLLCENNMNTDYTITAAANASSYIWTVSPANAATITNNSTTATFDWNNTFTGTAKISVKAVNNCGNSLTSDTLSITINPLPQKPNTPGGLTSMCQNAANSSYSTTSVNSGGFLWSIYPANAGVITGNTNTASVDWSDTYSGIAKISVRAVNNCGNSISSDSLTITINPLPSKPATPNGSAFLCENNINTTYTTTGSSNATSYSWSVYPSTAGNISGTTTSMTIDWNNTFTGIAKIAVKGVNACGSGVVSDTLEVTVNPLPLKPSIPNGTTSLCQGSAATNYNTTGSTNATAYLWSLSPATAGSISGTSVNSTITWNAAFFGIAKIAVKGINTCGNSVSSDTLSVTINPLPAKPITPTGSSSLCENNANTNYSTTGSSNATSYLWSIYPATAGSITGTTTSAVVDWANTFIGTAKISVIGINTCGNSVSSDSLTVTINSLPFKPATPTGSTVLCENNINTTYTTTASSNATSYSWSVYPSTAGNISGTTTSMTIDWNNTFTGIAKISVKGVNACGTGVVSDTLEVTVNPLPLKPSIPNGTTSFCQGSAATNYNTAGSTNATAYLWSLSPATAGSISGTSVNSTITWNAAFSGIAKIAVKGINTCGNSVSSDTLSVNINPLPAKPITPTGSSSLCENNANTNYSSTGSSNATSYIWSIYPATAGNITGTTTSATVDWTNTFTGIAKISVIGINTCGNSVSSDSLTVTINSLPVKPSTPTGSTVLCENNINTTYTTTASSNATSYSWSVYPSTAGNISGTTTSMTIDWNNTFTGIAKISVKGVNACGTGVVSDTLEVTLNPLPLKPATPTGSTALCQGSAATNYNTAGSTNATAYLWSIYPTTAGSISGTSVNSTLTWNAAFSGIAKISVKGINNCGNSVSSDTLSVTINPLPVKPATPSGSTSLCENNANTNYSTTGSTNATSYLWSIYPATAGNITGTTTSADVDWTNTFTGIAKISVIGINACGNSVSSDSLTVTINSLPVKPATPTGSTVLCENNINTTYTTTGSSNATSYSWSVYPSTAGTITGTTTSMTIDWNNTFTGIAKIAVKGVNACGTGIVSDTLSVTINPLPLKPATPTGSTALCQGSAATNYNTAGSTYATAYLWSISPTTAGSISGTSVNSTLTWNAAFSGIAKISVKGINTCGNSVSSDTLSVTINPLPAKPATPSGSTSLCENAANTNYSTTGSANATSYLWSIYPANAGNITGTTTSADVDWTNTFTGIAKISVIGINTCGNSVSSDSLTVTINSLPVKPATPTGSTVLCENNINTNFTTTASSNATSYSWSVYPSTAGTITGTTTSMTIDWNNTFTGIAKIAVKGVNACGTGVVSDTLEVTLNPLPLKPATPTGLTALCQGSAATNYNTAGSTHATAYLWSISPTTAGSISGTSVNTTITWNAAFSGIAKISVKGINTCGNSVSSDTLSVTISPLPSKPATPSGSTSLCENAANTNYSSIGSSNATSYLWSIYPATAGNITGTTTSADVDWTNTFTGTAKISVIGINTCGNSVSSDSLTVTINSLPVKPATPSGPQNLSQNSTNSVYSTTGGLNATSYQWSISPSSAATISGTTTSATCDWDNTFIGTAKISVIGVNSCGNSIASDSLTVTITALPTADFINTTDSICPGSSDTLKINLSGASPWSLTYYNGSSNINIPNILSSAFDLVVSPTITTTYKLISVSDANWTAIVNDSAKIVIRSLPIAGFTKVINALNVNFTNTSSYATAYSWNFGDSSPISNQINPIHNYAAYGNYIAALTASNVCGSDNYQDSVKLSDVGVDENDLSSKLRIYPNPNKGIFELEINQNADDCQLMIYNQTGQMILNEKLKSNGNEIFRKSIDLTAFPKGIYLINLQSKEGIYSKKIIIQ